MQTSTAKQRISEFKRIRAGVKAGTVTIQEVDKFWNSSIKYKTDMAQFGARDYWQSPIETLTNGRGDCEDIAIGKFFTLVGFHDVYLCYCSVQISKVKIEMHMTCLVRKKRFFCINTDVNLDSQSRRITEIFRFNKINAMFRGRKSDNAVGINSWRTVMNRAENEAIMYGTH